MRMLNDYLLCEVVGQKEESKSGFQVENENKVKTLVVLESGQDDVPKGSKLIVPVNSGLLKHDNLVYIKRSDIIEID